LREHHEGYIDWDTYERNRRLIADNAQMKGVMVRGAAREGRSLLSGLLRCGRCGRKLQVAYSGNDGRVPRYVCRGDRGDRESNGCLTIGGLRVDRAVVGSVLAAIEPAGIEAAIKMSDCVHAEDDEKRKALELA